MHREFERVAILNRGHVAMRFIHSVRELNREHGTAIRTIALFTEGERGARYVREADEAVGLGSATFVDPSDGRRKSRYVDRARVAEALVEARADAAWIGWGFVPEHLQTAALCQALNVRLLGPPLDVLRRLSDKIATKQLAISLGIAVVPWSAQCGGESEALAEARRLGFPVFVKPALGGAGRALARARDEAELPALLERTREKARTLLEDETLYLEQALPDARLLSVQAVADSQGTVWSLGVRESSVQHRFTKFLDEAPATGLSEAVARSLEERATTLLSAAGYEGAASVEFLYDPARGEPLLLEVNPRLETAHDVIEATTGVDLVKLQVLVARGEKLVGAPPSPRGHALEVRIRAEDPSHELAPTPGVVASFRAPTGPGIRVESSLVAGDDVPPGFSTLLAKLIAHGRSRAEALSRMERALRETLVVLRGGTTTRAFLLSLVTRPELSAGTVGCDWLDRLVAEGQLLPSAYAHEALSAAAIEESDRALSEERTAFLRGRPLVRPGAPHAVALRYRGHVQRFVVARTGPVSYRVEHGASTRSWLYERQGPFERRLTARGGRSLRVLYTDDGLSREVEVEGALHRVFDDGGGVVRAPTPGVVQAIAVTVGARVARGDRMLVLEAMKMEMALRAPFGGRVREVLAVENVPVAAGAPLVQLEGESSEEAELPGEATREPALDPWLDTIDCFRRLILGYDVDDAELSWQLARYRARAPALAAVAPRAGHDDERLIVATFVAVATLFRRVGGARGSEPPALDLPRTSGERAGEELLTTFLRTRDERAHRELPPSLSRALRLALSHYGVDTLSPGPALDDALFWIFRAHEREALAVEVAQALCERWLAEIDVLALREDPALATLLDGLLRALEGRHPALSELALDLSYRLFEQPRVAGSTPPQPCDAPDAPLSPALVERLRLGRLSAFELSRLPAEPDVYLFRAVARASPSDERLIAFAEIGDLHAVRTVEGKLVALPHFERRFRRALASIRAAQRTRPSTRRLSWNRIELVVSPPLSLTSEELRILARKLAPATEGLGIEKVIVRGPLPHPGSGRVEERAFELSKPAGMSLRIAMVAPIDAPLAPLSAYEQKVARLRQRGLTHPYEILRMLTPARDDASAEFPPGELVEYDLVEGELVPVARPPGQNVANIVVAVLTSFPRKLPEGMARVVLLGDPSRSLGALAEPECARIIAALALAERLRVPVEWFALSSGAKIAMDSGTENMDWIAAVLRRIVQFTQRGGELNVIVMGINVGAQPYWNAEATMLMHTRGILIMLPQSAMVLTGKRALDYSGGVSAEDDAGIGGYERVMGPNGQAQYLARDVADACRILLRHYDHCYVRPGERFPRRAETRDPRERDVSAAPHGDGFATVGEVFSEALNPDRKKPFHIRKVMAAAIDQDAAPLERWADMRDAEVAVIWDAHLGGYPVCLIGIESEPLARRGSAPLDGPTQWTGGTLFPMASKKIARAVNAASGNRPLVVLANLSGFDGSPESMRKGQLELGAEIGRAVVNFEGPIVFCVVSRFHGGAYVVFSHALNESLELCALTGSRASVIGGAPAAGVVFAGDVETRTQADPRVSALRSELVRATDADKGRLRAELSALERRVRAEQVGAIAEAFDREHSVERALRVGSLHRIIPPEALRPYLIDAVERGMSRTLDRSAHDVSPVVPPS